MNGRISSFQSFFVLGTLIAALSGCATFSGPSYGELEDQAEAQRDLLLRREEYRVALAEVVQRETQSLSDQGIATGRLKSRKPYIGARLNDPR